MNNNGWEIFDQISQNIDKQLEELENLQTQDNFFQTTEQLPEDQFSEWLNQLLEQYKNKTLDQVFDAQIIENSAGFCWKIQWSEHINLKLIDLDLAQEKLINDLKLIFGIKEAREKQLKAQGYKTLYHLTQHQIFGQQAQQIIQLLENQQIEQIQNLIKFRYNAWSAPIAFYLSAFYDKQHFLFFDIESLGIYHQPIILFGIATIKQNQLNIEQFLITDFDQEPAALLQMLHATQQAKALVSFNGRAFDYNYINQRLIYNQLNPLPQLPHFDLFHFAKRHWNFLPDSKLKTFERYLLDVQRPDDLPSELVPFFFRKFLETQNIGPLVPIILHNKQDIVSLAKLFAELHRQIALQA